MFNVLRNLLSLFMLAVSSLIILLLSLILCASLTGSAKLFSNCNRLISLLELLIRAEISSLNLMFSSYTS